MMNFSEMKVRTMNGVKWYFNRDWNRDDMMNFDEIPVEVQRRLTKVHPNTSIFLLSFFFITNVYLSLFCAMLSSTFGIYLEWISIEGAKYAVLSYVANMILLYFTPSGGLNTRIIISMCAAYSFGSSFGFFSNYLFKMQQSYVVRFLAGITIGLGNFSYRAFTTTDRSKIYFGCLQYCFGLLISGIALVLLDRHTALWTITIHTLLIYLMGYFVIYSQEILYYANLGHIDFVNCTFTVFLHLPGILIHAARLYLQGPEIEQHEQNLELTE